MGNRVYCWLMKLNIIIVGWKTYMLTRLPSLTHSVDLYYRKWRKSLRWANHQVIFVYKSAYVYICYMTCNVFVYAYWSVSEHDTPSFDYIMKCISWWNALINIILSCFVLGTNSATLLNQKNLLWNYFKKHKWNRSFLAVILGMSHLHSRSYQFVQ